MTGTRIDIPFNKVARMRDLADLAEALFPGNRNQQHAFHVVWLALKWQRGLVPNLYDVAAEHGVTRRTVERVRAKLRRLGLIEHVSRLSARYGYRDGWMFSTRFERSLRCLVDAVGAMKDPKNVVREKELLLLELAAGRRAAVGKCTRAQGPRWK